MTDKMTAEEIKRIVDDERAEQLTALLCRHWEVATQRLAELVQDLEADIDVCAEAEVYAAMMRMQSCVMSLMELSKIPCFFLFSGYLDRISKTVSNESIRQSVVALLERMNSDSLTRQQESFFDALMLLITQHNALTPEKQAAIAQKVSYTDIISSFMKYLKPEDLIMLASVVQDMNREDNADGRQEIIQRLTQMHQTMEELSDKMGENLNMMVIGLAVLVVLPAFLANWMSQRRMNSKPMADIFNQVLEKVRQSSVWWEYWKVRRKTLRVVSDSSSWKEIINAEGSKVRSMLGEISGGLFAKWTTDRKAFEEDFLDARLDDDTLRNFIFHLVTLYEITREQNPTTKYGNEQLVKDERQQVGDAVLEAALKLHDLTTAAWFPHYEAMWQELIKDETIFAHLKVTRKSPHNNLFTARFFCHLVGEMKKSAVFGAHSDGDLAEKLTEKQYVGTFRKNVQEGMGEEKENVQKIFNAIYQKYKQLANPKR